jgi:urea transport system permease protein
MLGALIVTGVQGALSESETFLETWTLIMGLLFVLVVLFLPKGIAGAVEAIAGRMKKPAVTPETPNTETVGAARQVENLS